MAKVIKVLKLIYGVQNAKSIYAWENALNSFILGFIIEISSYLTMISQGLFCCM